MTGNTNTNVNTSGYANAQEALDAFGKSRRSIVSATKRFQSAEASLVQSIGEGNSKVLNYNGDTVNVTIINGRVNFSFVDVTETNENTAATGITTPTGSSAV